MKFKSPINNKFAMMRFDSYLAMKYPYNSRSEWQRKILEKKVLLNERIVKPSVKIPKNSSIIYDMGEFEEFQVNRNYKVIFEDDSLLIIDKPPNIPVHASGKFFNNTLISIIRNDFSNNTLALVNRLDRETSGIIVIGKTYDARKKMCSQFFKKTVQKTYIAYCFGFISDNNFVVTAPISPNVSETIRIKMGVDFKKGAFAETKFEVIKKNNNFTKIYCYPVTGRTNQIRVHLSYIGHPIVGDKLYSGNDRDFLDFIENGNSESLVKRLVMPRQCLHAHKLSFIHPDTNKKMTIYTNEPDDMLDFENNYLI